jgi:hypothetical protein
MIVLGRAILCGQLRAAIPAGVLAQVFRDPAKQARLAALLNAPAVEVVALDEITARAIGQLCARTGASDVIDASVVICARQRRHAAVVTGDPADIGAIDPGLRTEAP